ncbi:uncharacterized protein BDZ99DRAFT_193788 [Mytilinidion resinicola]|uniref:RING-type domain-containing protein n=1 Tax=Mytilinidion resinicola TaxID=574789 RepID=A0A6A6Z556_9PEZI|nr:uncharacterized protein BDZ99DRAFT_193788 [Mytilinidion resinicola]KAF2815315.1 hypothetical protein BDZ99DRAFT_193788 [Mytilinidion resinicola]
MRSPKSHQALLTCDLPTNLSLDIIVKELSDVLIKKHKTVVAFNAVIEYHKEHRSQNRVESLAFLLWRLRALARQLETDCTFGVEEPTPRAVKNFEDATHKTVNYIYNEFNQVCNATFNANSNHFTEWEETVMENTDPDIENLDGIATEVLLTQANDACPICLEDWGSEHVPFKLKCGHIAGYFCLITWLNSAARTSNRCVSCRFQISKERPRRPKPDEVQDRLPLLFTLLEELYYIFGRYKPKRCRWPRWLKFVEDNVRFLREDPQTGAWAAGYGTRTFRRR